MKHKFDPSLDVKQPVVNNRIIKLAGKVKHRFLSGKVESLFFSFCPLKRGYWKV